MKRTRRIPVGLFVVFSVAAGCAAPTPESNEEIVGVAQSAITGAVGDWTGFTDGQCVHGVYSFYAARFGISLPAACAGGNVGICETCGACMIWESAAVNPPASLFNKYAWGATMPQLYDIVVLPPNGGVTGYGHVAAVDHMTSSSPSDWQHMYVVDSNWYGDEKVCSAVHTLNRQPYGIFRLKSLDNPPPRGFLDIASCDQVGGWAQDPSAPDQAIHADLYYGGPAGDASAVGIRLLADIHRPDLCTAIGSCDHGFSMAMPRGAMDGMPHQVFAYGIDTAGGTNPLLGDAPKSFTCPPPAMPKKVERRALASSDVLTAWKFSTYFDMATYGDADIEKLASGIEMPAAPSLIQVKGDAEIDVIDGNERRKIADTSSFASWRFSSDAVKTVKASERDGYAVGLAWPTTPLLVKSTDDDTVYVLDAIEKSGGGGGSPHPPQHQGSDGGGGAAATTTSDDGDAPNASDHGGCNLGGDPNESRGAAFALAALLGLALARRRRRS